MSVSSGTVSLFATAAFAIAAAGGVAYGLKHKSEIQRAIAEIKISVAAKSATGTDADGAGGDQSQSSDDSSENNGDVTLRAGNSGHFETPAEINGRSVDVMVDTGATMVAMTYEDAERAGIFPRPSEFTASASTANGIAKFAPVNIGSITIGNITVRNVQGAVSERGKLKTTLLGMTFLSRLNVEMRKNVLVLRQ
jgi:aspartyl protease family protein